MTTGGTTPRSVGTRSLNYPDAVRWQHFVTTKAWKSYGFALLAGRWFYSRIGKMIGSQANQRTKQ